MASTLRSLIERIYPSARGTHRVVIGGLDYTGKTTLLYLLKMNELVTTIPSIGFNVETVDITTSPPGNKQLRLDMWDVGSGCGGPSLMIRMLRWYLPGAKALIWMVDSTDVRGEEAIKEGLQVLLSDVDALPEMADRHIPILMYASLVISDPWSRLTTLIPSFNADSPINPTNLMPRPSTTSASSSPPLSAGACSVSSLPLSQVQT
jgi:hypothetical protein